MSAERDVAAAADAAGLEVAGLDAADMLPEPLEAGMVEEAVAMPVMLVEDMLPDAMLELEEPEELELLLPEETVPPITPPLGASAVVTDLAATVNLSMVISDPLGLR